MRSLLIVAALSCATISCSRQPPAPPVPQPAPALPAPNLDALVAIVDDLTVAMPTLLMAHLYPDAAGLSFGEEAPEGARAELTAWLESNQPLIERGVALSSTDLEPFPPLATGGPNSDFNLNERHPSTAHSRLGEVLLADASRLFDAGDIDGAIVRLTAVLNLAAERINEPDGVMTPGGRLGARAAMRFSAIVRDGDPSKVSKPTADNFRKALGRFNPSDPNGAMLGWETRAREAVLEVRTRFAIRGGPKAYGAFFREHGIDETMVSVARLVGPNFADFSIRKDFADTAEDFSAKELGAATDAAEAMIPAVAAAMKSQDGTALDAVWKALEPAKQDKTHIARLIFGDAPTVVAVAAALKPKFDGALRDAERLP